MLRHRGVAEPPPSTYHHVAQLQMSGEVPRDTVRQADALAGHGKAMNRDGFRMGARAVNTERINQTAAAKRRKNAPDRFSAGASEAAGE